MTDRAETATRACRAVFFDLDGTLIDTAPDMVAILADLLAANGSEALPYQLARASVSNGAMGLIRLAFPEIDPDRQEQLYEEYLARYERAVCVHSTLFPGLPAILDDLDQRGLPWGVVTNKPRRMTDPLLAKLGLDRRAACVISGDTLPQRKPDPAPLLLASRLAGVPPRQSMYVGDAERDIVAGRAAGMATIAAGYGYIVSGDDPARWLADQVAPDTVELAKLIRKAVTLGREAS